MMRETRSSEFIVGHWLVGMGLRLVVGTMAIRAGLELAGAMPPLDRGRSRFTHFLVSAAVLPIVLEGTVVVASRVASGSWGSDIVLWEVGISIALGAAQLVVVLAFAGPRPIIELTIRGSDGRLVIGWLLVGTAGYFAADLLEQIAMPSRLGTLLDAALVPACLAVGVAALLDRRRAMRGLAVVGAAAALIQALHILAVGEHRVMADFYRSASAAAEFAVLVWLGGPDPGPTLGEVFA